MPNFDAVCAVYPGQRRALSPTVQVHQRHTGGSGTADRDQPGDVERRERLDLCLVGQRLGKTETGDIEAQRIRNAGVVVTGEAAVQLTDQAGIQDGCRGDRGMSACVSGLPCEVDLISKRIEC